MSGEQKLKDNDAIVTTLETTTNSDLLFFTNKCQVYKAKLYEFSDTKASVYGDYIPAKLSMDEGELALSMINTKTYEGFLLFAFENGKVAKVELSAYMTKTNRKKLINAYSDKSPLAGIAYAFEDGEFVLTASSGRRLLLHSASINSKTTKSTQGVAVMKLKKGHRVMSIEPYVEGTFAKPSRYRTRTLPALGALPSDEDSELDRQLSLL